MEQARLKKADTMNLIPTLLFALPVGGQDLDQAIELIRAGRDYEALGVLESLDSAPEAALWTLRAGVGTGKVTEALEAADSGELSEQDAEYLRGIAFHRQALDAIAGGSGGLVDFQFRDAASVLSSAVAADPARYSDAFTPLTEALWNTQQLEDARKAGEQAAQRTAANPRAHHLLGEVCFSQYIAVKADEKKAEEAGAHHGAAQTAFRGALGVIDKDVAGHASMGAKAASKLGDLAVWKEAPEEAATQYAVAVAWDPTAVNYGQVSQSIGNTLLVSCLKEGCEAFEARYGDRSAAESTPLWWLGWAQFQEKEYADCDETFGRVLKLFPAYTNSWWYRAEARFHQSNIDGFLECLHKLSGYGMEVLAAQVKTDFAHNSFVLSGALKKLSDERRLMDAAYICEVRVAADPKNWEVWDNLGLFCRDAGESLVGRVGFNKRKISEVDREEAKRLFERANEAYEQAFVLDETKPHLLNDRAVILDYYLDREHELAISLYEQALAQSTELLKDTEALSEFEQTLAETAKRDSANNVERLKKRLERERKKREREDAKKKEGESGAE